MLPDEEILDGLQRALGDGGSKLYKVVPGYIRRVIEGRLWELRQDKNGAPFKSFEAFVTHRLWQGLESTIEDMLSYCRREPEVQTLIRAEVEAVPAHGEVGRGRGSNTISNDERGATYALRRLKRDNPDLAEQVVKGEISAHRAAVMAGFRQETWSAPADPDRLAAAIERRFPDYRLVRVA